MTGASALHHQMAGIKWKATVRLLGWQLGRGHRVKTRVMEVSIVMGDPQDGWFMLVYGGTCYVNG